MIIGSIIIRGSSPPAILCDLISLISTYLDTDTVNYTRGNEFLCFQFSNGYLNISTGCISVRSVYIYIICKINISTFQHFKLKSHLELNFSWVLTIMCARHQVLNSVKYQKLASNAWSYPKACLLLPTIFMVMFRHLSMEPRQEVLY